jgi:abortive infection bacteriophage resistance protein
MGIALLKITTPVVQPIRTASGLFFLYMAVNKVSRTIAEQIALCTKLIYHLSLAYGGLWYLDDSLVIDKAKHQDYLTDLQNEFARNGESFAKDFRTRHPNENPDAWIIFEVATFGTLSKIYSNLKPQIPQKSIITHEFGLNFINDLSSWFAAISYLRNVIANHSRVFGRDILKRPVLPRSPRNQRIK